MLATLLRDLWIHHRAATHLNRWCPVLPHSTSLTPGAAGYVSCSWTGRISLQENTWGHKVITAAMLVWLVTFWSCVTSQSMSTKLFLYFNYTTTSSSSSNRDSSSRDSSLLTLTTVWLRGLMVFILNSGMCSFSRKLNKQDNDFLDHHCPVFANLCPHWPFICFSPWRNKNMSGQEEKKTPKTHRRPYKVFIY